MAGICVVCGNRSKPLEPGFPTCKGCTTDSDRERAAEPLFRQHFPICRFLKSGGEQGPCNCSQWLNGDYDIAQRLLDALYTHNWEPRAYSGRGMFGKQCIAVSLTGESQLWQLARTVPIDVDAPHTDQLGKGLIAYWPNYEWPKDEGKAMPWCDACGSYHHSTAPGCRAEHGPLLHFSHP